MRTIPELEYEPTDKMSSLMKEVDSRINFMMSVLHLMGLLVALAISLALIFALSYYTGHNITQDEGTLIEKLQSVPTGFSDDNFTDEAETALPEQTQQIPAEETQPNLPPPPPPQPCFLTTRDGRCVETHLKALHMANKGKWPGKVDIIIRTFHGRNMFLFRYFLQSVELFWPVGIAGDVLVILDDTPEDRLEAFSMPPWVKVKYEAVVPDLPGYAQQQLSMMLSDEHTDADFIAICDDDQVFNMLVTPESLFDSSGKPYWIGNREAGRDFYIGNSEYYNGPGTYAGNFMMALPTVFPRAILAPMRQHFESVHPELGSFRDIFLITNRNGALLTGQTVIANFAFNFMRDQVAFRMHDDDMPVKVVAAHIPASEKFHQLPGSANPKEKKYEKAFVTAASWYIREGICNTFPPEVLDGCEEVDVGNPAQYARDDGMFVSYRNHVEGVTKVHEDFWCWAWSVYFQGEKGGIVPSFNWARGHLECAPAEQGTPAA